MYYYRYDDDDMDLEDYDLYSDEELRTLDDYEVRPFCPYYQCCPMFAQAQMRSQMMRQNNYGPPKTPPPKFVPDKDDKKLGGPSLKAVDPGAIRPCLYRYVYIWQTNGRSYWAYITYVGKKSIAGWRWARFRWVYFGLDLNKIDSFYCL
ncbi:hypothetical protein ACFIJ5_12780 [Haloimpatiens sp. FM7330]|uniref:hypothetical protein n=1 Tax=Haloimpatiens sp. FM7330 TaxID=3298610 RepID=UPI00363ED3F4